jgi:hypothetical protein
LDPRASAGSPLYLLERSDVGQVQLDRDLKVVAMNDFARRALPVEHLQPFGKIVLSFPPGRSQSKVKVLLDPAECPVLRCTIAIFALHGSNWPGRVHHRFTRRQRS